MSNYRKYLDENGEPTYYVQNISQGHVCLSQLGITIPFGKVKDLREDVDVETLQRSPDLRAALAPQSGLLKRLAKEEYDQLLKIQIEQEAVLQRPQVTNPEIANEQGEVKEAKVNISPKCQSMVEKLKLYYRPETREKGITPDQFKVWLQNYTPTDDEKEYMMSVVGDKEIRSTLAGMMTKEDYEREKQGAQTTATVVTREVKDESEERPSEM